LVRTTAARNTKGAPEGAPFRLQRRHSRATPPGPRDARPDGRLRGEPGIHNPGLWLWIPGPRQKARPGMTERGRDVIANATKQSGYSQPARFLDASPTLAMTIGEIVGRISVSVIRHLSQITMAGYGFALPALRTFGCSSSFQSIRPDQQLSRYFPLGIELVNHFHC
jgi:hypothetical protein